MNNNLNKIVNIIEIQKLMKEKRITKRRLANELGFQNIGSLARYIRWGRLVGNNNIYSKLIRIANLLNVDIESILLENNSENIEYILDISKNKKMKGII